MPPANDLTVVDENGTDRDAPLGQPGLRFGDGGLQEFVHRPLLVSAPSPGLPRRLPGAAPTSRTAERLGAERPALPHTMGACVFMPAGSSGLLAVQIASCQLPRLHSPSGFTSDATNADKRARGHAG